VTSAPPTVHLLCGLNGSGKTTLARELEVSLPAVRFSLDEWMLRFYPGLHYASEDYGSRAETCKGLIWETALQVLRAGTDVVLDWNQWSRARRATWHENARAAGFAVLLHHVATPLNTAIERTRRRTLAAEPGSHALTDDGVRHLAGIFEEPSGTEGLRIHRVTAR